MKGFSGEPQFYFGDELMKHLRELIDGASEIYIASAWVSESTVSNLLISQSEKFKINLVVGVGGYKTDPIVLKKFGSQRNIALKVHGGAEPPLFHPKLYIFKHLFFRRVLIGSMNLTNAGATKNVETMLSFEDKAKQADKEFERFWTSPSALPFDKFDLATYEAKRRQMLASVKDSGAADVLDAEVAASSESRLDMDSLKEGWNSFVAELKNVPNSLDDYRRVLKVRRELVDRNWSEDLSQHELDIMWGNAPYYAFGHLMAVKEAQFQGESNRFRRQQIGTALKSAAKLQYFQVPIVEGIVRQLLDVDFCKAALTTRLLVLVRPDLFVVVNKKSFEGLQERFDLPVSNLKFSASNYVKLLEKIHATPWYRSPEPEDPFERELWQARAAFIDPLVYRKKPEEGDD